MEDCSAWHRYRWWICAPLSKRRELPKAARMTRTLILSSVLVAIASLAGCGNSSSGSSAKTSPIDRWESNYGAQLNALVGNPIVEIDEQAAAVSRYGSTGNGLTSACRSLRSGTSTILDELRGTRPRIPAIPNKVIQARLLSSLMQLNEAATSCISSMAFDATAAALSPLEIAIGSYASVARSARLVAQGNPVIGKD